MRTLTIGICIVTLLAATTLSAPDDLAERANAIEWKIPPESSDLVPAGLRALQRELLAKGPEVVEEIRTSLDRSLHLRRIASQVLVKHPGDAARAMLIALLEDEDAFTAFMASAYIGEIGGAEMVEPLIRAVAHQDPNVCHNALNSLGQMGAADRAAEAAIDAIEDPEHFVRHSAADCLQNLHGSANGKQAIAALEHRMKYEEWRDAADAMELTVAILKLRFPE